MPTLKVRSTEIFIELINEKYTQGAERRNIFYIQL